METLEQVRERTGMVTGPMGLRLSDNFRATPPNGHEGLTDDEMEAVCRRDLGCKRRSVYRDLGRGQIALPGGGRTRYVQKGSDEQGA